MKTMNETSQPTAKKAKVTKTSETKKLVLKKKTKPAEDSALKPKEKPGPMEKPKPQEITPQAKKKLVKEDSTKKATREIKYIYPDDVKDSLARKKFRAAARKKLKALQIKMKRLETADDKSYKEAQKEYDDYRNSILKA